MSNSDFVVRPIASCDRSRWQELWEGYTRFYEREPTEIITNHLWSRIMNPKSLVNAVVAEDGSQIVVGIANYILHENTRTLSSVCYLQDLFVDLKIRRNGAGRSMLDWLLSEMKIQGWANLYWNTKENNYRARGLYDRYTQHSGFLRYALQNSERHLRSIE